MKKEFTIIDLFNIAVTRASEFITKKQQKPARKIATIVDDITEDTNRRVSGFGADLVSWAEQRESRVRERIRVREGQVERRPRGRWQR